MKTVRVSLIALFAAGLIGHTAAKSVIVDRPSYLSKLELAVLEELNLARMYPQTYAKLLEDYRATFEGNVAKRQGKNSIATNEGTAAVDEAIRALKAQSPLDALRPSQGMSRAAKDHAKDIGGRGAISHNGQDGSAPADRISRYGTWETTAGENISFGMDSGRGVVIQLIVDDGVPGRGHRINIYNPEFQRVGIACGPHKSNLTILCVQAFAGEYSEK